MIDNKRGVLRTSSRSEIPTCKDSGSRMALASLGRAPVKPESAFDFVCVFYSDNFVNLFSFTHLWHFKFSV